MSPPDDSDRSTTHVQPDRLLDNSRSHLNRGLISSSASTMDPENFAGATRVQLEMVELDRQLARIRLRCRNLVASTTSETSTATTDTITSNDSVSSSSSTRAVSSADRDWPLTPSRRAVVPRMGIRRHCATATRPFDDQAKDIGMAQPHEAEIATPLTISDKTSTANQFNNSSNPPATYTRRLCCDSSHNTDHLSQDPVKDFQVKRLAEPENTTNTIIHINASVQTYFCSTPVARTTHPDSENTVNYEDITSAPYQSNSVCSQSFTSADARCLDYEYDRLSNNVEHPLNNNPAVNWPSSSTNNALVDTADNNKPISPNNISTSPPHRLTSSSTVTTRSLDYDRKMNETGDQGHSNFATDRTSVGSCATVSGGMNRSSQTDDVDADRRRRSQRQELYRRYADVMYTNPFNLEHTIAVQQALFLQQVDGPETQQDPEGDGAPSRRADQAMEWVVKRRADGSRYITRRPAKCPRSRRAERRRTAEDRRQRQRVETTTDDGRSECKAGRYWTRHERRRQVIINNNNNNNNNNTQYSVYGIVITTMSLRDFTCFMMNVVLRQAAVGYVVEVHQTYLLISLQNNIKDWPLA